MEPTRVPGNPRGGVPATHVSNRAEPTHRRGRGKTLTLKVASNIPPLTGLAPWELEFLAPFVAQILGDILTEDTRDEDG